MATFLLALLTLLIFDGIEAAGKKSEKYCDEVYSKTFSLNNPTTIIEQFPFMAAIGFSNYPEKDIKFECAGILISEKYVMTAATCLRDYGFPEQVKFGITNLNATNNEDIIQTRKISKNVVHPDYDRSVYFDNVGLIELKEPVALTKDVKPICLENEKKPLYPSMVTASLGLSGIAKKLTRKLKKFTVKQYSNAECKKIHPGLDEASVICAGNRPFDFPLEPGDPLIVIDPTYGYRIVGVSSFGRGYTRSFDDIPSIFFRVSNYIGWIESVVWP